jgi:hypothetical protein
MTSRARHGRDEALQRSWRGVTGTMFADGGAYGVLRHPLSGFQADDRVHRIAVLPYYTPINMLRPAWAPDGTVAW